MFGYVQLAAAQTSPNRMAEQLEESARSYGGSVWGRIFCEARSPVRDLWALLHAFDRESGAQVVARLWQFAERERVDLEKLLRSAPPTSALWSLLDALDNADAGHLLVPSPEHFDNLGVPRHVLLHRISQVAPQAKVLYVDSSLGCGERPGRIAEFEVPAFSLAEEIVELNLRKQLTRSGLGDLVEAVDDLMHELVGDAVRASVTNLGSEPGRMRVEVWCPPESATVMVELYETRDHADEPVSEAVQQICGTDHGGSARRARSDTGGTVTRCEIPLPGLDRRNRRAHPPMPETNTAELTCPRRRPFDDQGHWLPPGWAPSLPGGR
ncbi:hypothetical protein NONI108955_23500 [Nocardia ninae]|nr:hypothetical protein [Nocardia ninae]